MFVWPAADLDNACDGQIERGVVFWGVQPALNEITKEPSVVHGTLAWPQPFR